MQVELRSIFSEIKSRKPRSIALIYRNLKSWEEWEEGEKVIRRKHEEGADKFSAELVKAGIECVPISGDGILGKAGDIANFDMCVITGEPYYSLLTIGADVLKTGYRGPLFLEITSAEAERMRDAKIAAANAVRVSATGLLSNLVYLTKKPGEIKTLAFPLEESEDSKVPDSREVLIEGRSRSVLLTKIERNPTARRKCIEVHGARCALCGFDFSKRYGVQGEGLIHIHHLNRISETMGERAVDPENDLLPVCPNCHFFIHSRSPMYSPEEVLALLASES